MPATNKLVRHSGSDGQRANHVPNLMTFWTKSSTNTALCLWLNASAVKTVNMSPSGAVVFGCLFIVSDHIEEIQRGAMENCKVQTNSRAGTALVPLYLEEVETFRSLTMKPSTSPCQRPHRRPNHHRYGRPSKAEGWIESHCHKHTAYIECRSSAQTGFVAARNRRKTVNAGRLVKF